jgi:hypothetical protein
MMQDYLGNNVSVGDNVKVFSTYRKERYKVGVITKISSFTYRSLFNITCDADVGLDIDKVRYMAHIICPETVTKKSKGIHRRHSCDIELMK